MTHNLFVTAGYKPSGTRAKNINTIDEVPDSSWFTNRIGTTPITADEIARGPIAARRPTRRAGCSSREKTAGAHPGFTARDANGETWFLEFDPPDYPGRRDRRRSTIATKIFWALGYNQVETFLTTFDPRRVDDRSEGHDAAAVRREDAVHARRHATRSSNEPRATRTAPIASSPAG